jgi:hypothetical protein
MQDRAIYRMHVLVMPLSTSCCANMGPTCVGQGIKSGGSILPVMTAVQLCNGVVNIEAAMMHVARLSHTSHACPTSSKALVKQLRKHGVKVCRAVMSRRREIITRSDLQDSSTTLPCCGHGPRGLQETCRNDPRAACKWYATCLGDRLFCADMGCSRLPATDRSHGDVCVCVVCRNAWPMRSLKKWV